MALPTGPGVAFLFTDIEGSTRTERAVGAVAWADVVGRHDELVRDAIETGGGAVVKTEGDAFFAAFADAGAAMRAAVVAQRALAAEPWPGGLGLRVRMGIHLGEGRLRARRTDDDAEDYVGIDVNYAARIAAAANGGQIVLSDALVRSAQAAATRDDAGLTGTDVVLVGLRAVKDFEEPAALYRLVVPGAADDARPLRTLDVPTNLPGDVTDLVGRELEIVELTEALAGSRAVTLTGPGGSGKTRLALAVARAVLPDHPHGAWFVDLAAVRDPALIESAIASALGVRESPDLPIAAALAVHLRERDAVLLLDNLEQLLPAGAEVIARLLRGAPGLRVLATSRELLRIAGERGYPVPPLERDAGVALFLDRARAHRPELPGDTETLAAARAIVDRLGGLPLAIELAAARVRMLSPTALLERLHRSLDLGGGARDLPERQRTLRGAVAWSYELLPEAERVLYARLGVFAAGWTADQAIEVADADGDLGIDAVEGLESLVDKSLVRIDRDVHAPVGADDVRFGMHPLLREYAVERLDERAERASTEERFAKSIASFAETVPPQILGPGAQAILHRLDHEDRNLRAAVDWSIANGQPEIGLRILGSTWRWFQQRGRIREARAILAELLPRTTSVDPRVRCSGLAAEGGLAYWVNDLAAARAAYEERLERATAIGDPDVLAEAHYDLGFVAMVEQDAESLRAHEQAAVDLYTAAGNEDGIVRARQALVLAVFLAGDYAEARALEHVTLEAFKRKDSPFQIADSLTLLSAVEWRRGDPASAWAYVVEALHLFSAIDSASGMVRDLAMASIILLTDGDPEVGARVAGRVYRLSRDTGAMLAPVHVLHLPEPLDLARERLGAVRADELLAEGEALPLEEVTAIVLGLDPPILARGLA